jgi:signal transduction histidine kinase
VRNLSVRLRVPHANGELRSMAETLNEMLERIEQSVRRITQFTADASHDLRTPLALIRSNSEFALRKSRTESEYRKALTRNLITSIETTRMVENLLSLARADAGAADLKFERFDLATRLKRAADDASLLATDKDIQLESSEIAGPIWVNADRLAIDRVFRILLENAMKYTPRGGSVGVSSRATDASIAEVRIRDSGIGISETDLPHIFERFYRADQARSRETGGSGLGLAIARTFVDLHGGTIEVQSRLGSGSLFLIRMPLSSSS